MLRILGISIFAILFKGMVLAAGPAAAQIRLEPAFPETAAAGPERAAGVVVWSHGRSVEAEDSLAPSPLYLKTLRDAGWDVLRLNRMRVSDTLPNSSRALAGHVEALKRQGYRKVVLAGQSFGAFISLMAAGRTDRVDAVIGTAPAAFGSFSDSFESWRENAWRLYPVLHDVRNARVMLFFFHHDDFDPGGRGDQSRAILAGRGVEHLVIDQPANLVGHGAANSGLFVRRFGACITRFAEAAPQPGEPPCDAAWGRDPDPGLLRVAASSGSAPPSGPMDAPAAVAPFLGTWHGIYVNGREVLLSVRPAQGNAVTADYILGPGVEPDQELEQVRRTGRLEDGELVFEEKGRNTLRYRLRPDGKLAATWLARTGRGKLDTVLRRVR